MGCKLFEFIRNATWWPSVADIAVGSLNFFPTPVKHASQHGCYGLQNSSFSITSELVRNLNSQAPLRATESEIPELGLSNQCFNSPPSDSDTY